MPRKKPQNKIKDSDADGLNDGLEKKLGTDPKKADSDSDGVNDYEEVNVYGTDPLNADTDRDGMKDGAEIKHGRNPKGPGLLKDLFIPHPGNDFKPQALQPNRLLFYALNSILLKTILIGAVIIMPIEAWLTPDILVEQGKKIIALTNAIRQNLSLAVLAENNTLDQAAYNKAEDMLLNQYFSHTGPDGKKLSDWLKADNYNYAMAGENLAMGFASPEEVVNGWSRSQTHYQNMIDPDFKQIGVGLAAGLYNNYDTTFVAQYFGAPTVEVALAAENSPVQTKAATSKPDTAPPAIDQARSKLYLDQPVGQNQKIVRAEVYLSADAVKARVNFNNYFIDLAPAPGETDKWQGQTIIFNQDQDQIFNPVVMATVTAEDQAGNKATEDLAWQNITPAPTALLKQYYFIKQHQSPLLKPLFDVTSIYYKIILLIASIALALNIFIQITKQHPHIILSTLGLISLLAALIIF